MDGKFEKVGIAGVGALGRIVATALTTGIDGYELAAVSNLDPVDLEVPNVSFSELAERCDVIVECLPAAVVPALAAEVLPRNKTLLLISSCALILYPEITKYQKGRVLVPSGALAGLDAVMALSQKEISSATIISTKSPAGFKNNSYLIEKSISLDDAQNRVMIFSGNVNEAAKHFPANINVAATLALAGIGPDKTQVEIWADPDVNNNTHEIVVEGPTGIIRSRIENLPDPSNPKSSVQAAYSLIAALKKRVARITYY